MKIAMLAPVSWRTPPRHYGPWELVSSLITEGLVKEGIDVTLFATADSITSAKLDAVIPKGYSEDPEVDAKVAECLHIANCFEKAGEFDLIHNQFDFLPLTYSQLVQTPVVTTIHGFSSEKILAVYEKYNAATDFISISNASRHPKLSYLDTVYHGIPMEQFELNEKAGEYLLFFGRLDSDKGAAEAIQTAKLAKRPLILAGLKDDEAYFKDQVEPHLGKDGIEYIGPVGPEKRNQILGGAIALLHLINFDEPFGLSLVESMACGTPVIARGRGSIPELITPGKHGAIVDSPQEAARMVDEVGKLDRSAIREHVQSQFSQSTMVKNYIRVYERVLDAHR